jgi:hypothetical protein
VAVIEVFRRRESPIALVRRLVAAGLMVALVVAISADVMQFEASRECRGGAFSSGFSGGFDVRRCDVVVRRFGDDLFKIPLPASW